MEAHLTENHVIPTRRLSTHREVVLHVVFPEYSGGIPFDLPQARFQLPCGRHIVRTRLDQPVAADQQVQCVTSAAPQDIDDFHEDGGHPLYHHFGALLSGARDSFVTACMWMDRTEYFSWSLA